MLNLLNNVAAAAGSMVRRRSLSPFEQMLYGVMNWIYRNLCWYGMQIQRSAHRLKRTIKRAVRPVVKSVRNFYHIHIRRPIVGAWGTTRSIAADSKSAIRTAGRVRSQEGFGAMLLSAGRSMAHGAAKYKTFLATAVNYCLPVLCIAILLLTATTIFSRNYVLAVECDGTQVGYISDESTYVEATELVGERVISASEDFQSAITPTYSLVAVDGSNLNNSEEICNNILVSSDDVDEAYGFFVDDKLIGAVKSEGDLTFILDEFLEAFRTGAANETVSFIGTTDIVKGLYSGEKIVSSADFKEDINARKMETQIYTIKSGDTLDKILGRYSLSKERFLELNENFDGNLRQGGTVLIEKEQPVLRVQSVVVSSYEKTIAFSKTTEKDASRYTTYKKLKTAGQNGLQKITQEITYVDGVEVSRNIIKTETIKEPVTEVYVVGTKKTTTTRYSSNKGSFSHTAKDDGSVVGSGRFSWPLPGVTTVSSRYGYRWGRLHSGIDISCGGVYGRTIVAADSGTVTAVKNSPSGYGLHVIISHGNGYSTLYAHCSSVSVSAGQRVSKGQAIAKVGNSGRSTGPHLHFEIRVNGKAKNPMNWY
ncbi:MAG: M23 family metallopeptidase [Clostridia bacterium]|nr:M23 family metallopeptidase [Clostridia bacterium]